MSSQIYQAPHVSHQKSYRQTFAGLTSVDNKASAPNENCASDDAPKWYAALKRPEWWLVGLGFPTLFFLGWQAWESRKAAQAANRNLESIIRKERARVQVKAYKVPDLSPIANGVPSANVGIVGVYYQLENIGPTLAEIVEGRCCLVFGSKDVPTDYTECRPMPFTGTIKGNSLTDISGIAPLEPLGLPTQAQAIDIRNRNAFIHFYGFVRYRDVYERMRRVRIHLRWVITWGLMIQGQVMECWEPAGAKEENSDVEEYPQPKTMTERFEMLLGKLQTLLERFPPN